MGAGWFTYRSFAASNAFVDAAWKYSSGRWTTEKKKSTGKNEQRLARLAPGASMAVRIFQNDFKGSFNRSGWYQFCITTRYENPRNNRGPASITLSAEQEKGIGSGVRTRVTTNRSSYLADRYTNECTRSFVGWDRDALKVTVRNNGPSTILVGIIQVVRL